MMTTTLWEERILSYCDRYEFQPALKLTQLGLTRNPDSGRLWELQGLIYFGMQDYFSAVRGLERATMLKPLTNPARICLAQAYGKTGRNELSLDLLKGLISCDLLSVINLLQLASALDEFDHPELALQACRRAMQDDPSNAQACYDMGYYSARCGCPPHVTEALARKAISLNPDEIRYQVGLASLLIKQQRRVDALKVISKFRDEDLERIGCRCCLQRILDLYEQYGDFHRTTLCRQRLMILDQQNSASDCDE